MIYSLFLAQQVEMSKLLVTHDIADVRILILLICVRIRVYNSLLVYLSKKKFFYKKMRYGVFINIF
jgi:hypothetical protein